MKESENKVKLDKSLHDANQARWNAGAARWKEMHDQRGDWRKCHQAPELVFFAQEIAHFKNLTGKKICVLGSGDNLAAFALAGMGADVTSVDISMEQLKVAQKRAEVLGLKMEFICADVTDLRVLNDARFDLVYTGGHVAVWVSDLYRYYAEACRILKSNGIFLVNEYHPFRRVWKSGVDHLEIAYDYYDRGPFEFDWDEDILHKNPGGLRSYEFHWRISDFVQSMINAGCQIIESHELGTYVGDWEGAPMQGLPEFFLLVGKKLST